MFFFPARTLADSCLGEHNSFAIRMLQQISQNPGGNYNPCLLYGDSATGKTFLLHQFKQWIQKDQKNLELQWIEPKDFQRNYVDSLRTRKLFHFHEQYQRGVFIMDNLQTLSGRKTLEQFRYLFDDLLQSKTQMLFASPCHPSQLQKFPESLRSRLHSGMVIPLKIPDLESRITFITRQCELISAPVKAEVVRWLAENLECSFLSILKQLERLYRLDPFIFLSLQECQNQFVRPVPLSLGQIQEWVEKEFTLHNTLPLLTLHTEKKRIQHQRNYVCILAHHYCQIPIKSLEEAYAVKRITIKRTLQQSQVLLEDPALMPLWQKFKKEFFIEKN